MTVTIITLDQLPKSQRKRISPIKKTRDWKETMDRIVAGDFDALKVEFSRETLKVGSSVADRFKRMLADEIKRLGLTSTIRLTSRGITSEEPILYVVRRDKQQSLFSSPRRESPGEQTAQHAVKRERTTRQQTKSRVPRSDL